MIRTASSALVLYVCAIPAQVWACPACSPGRDDAARQAFFDTTVFLTLLPIMMFAGIVYWIAKRVRAADQASREVPEATPAASAAAALPDLRA